jgi:ABC-type sugar transport system substrate-binding protein
MSKGILRVLALLFLLSAAGAARAQSSDPCASGQPSDPAYYADMKEVPGGRWNLGGGFEKAQLDNPSVPVVVRGLKSISSAKQHAVKYGCVELENRSPRAVKSVQLRWSLVARGGDGAVSEGAPILTRGTLPVIEVFVKPGVKLMAEVRGAHYADFLKPLVTATGEVNGQYIVYIGVARVEYADGTAEDLP